MKDEIPGWLQHCHKTCCEKDGHCGRQACIIRRQYYHRDVISGWVDNKGLERMVDMQLQVQNLVKLATVANIKLINIKTNLL